MCKGGGSDNRVEYEFVLTSRMWQACADGCLPPLVATALRLKRNPRRPKHKRDAFAITCICQILRLDS